MFFLYFQFGYAATVLECDKQPKSVNTDQQIGLWWFSFVGFIFLNRYWAILGVGV